MHEVITLAAVLAIICVLHYYNLTTVSALKDRIGKLESAVTAWADRVK